MVRDLLPGPNNGMGDSTIEPGMFAAIDGTLYFKGIVGLDSGGVYGYQLVRSDGTFSGTTPVTIVPSALGGDSEIITVGNSVFYSMNVFGSPTWQLWKSDGTSAGTFMVKEFPIRHGDEGHFKVVGSTLYFLANDGIHGLQHWKSDGTEEGTTMVTDPAEFRREAVVGNTHFFVADDELWRTDGTTEGTVALTTHSGTTASAVHASNIGNFAVVGQTLLFSAEEETHGNELWRSDGTVAGTLMVKDIVPGIDRSLPRDFVVIGGVAVFAAGNDLWRSDGTADGTMFVSPAEPRSLDNVEAGGYLYYAGDDGVHGLEPWRTDGTPGGTTIVSDIAPGLDRSGPAWFTDLGGTVFFAADDGVNGDELWKTDGTEAGTSMVANIAPVGGSGPSALFPLGNTLFFVADDQTHGAELWKTSIPATSIAGFTPALGPPGTTVTVSGKSLGEATGVAVNGVGGHVAAASDKSVRFDVPSSATSGKISVRTTVGTAVSSSAFRVIHAPRILSVSPMSGGTGSTVTITGMDLDVVTGVTLGGHPVPFVGPMPTRLTFTIPPGASGGTIAVTNPAGVTTTTTPFVVPTTPIIDSFSPALGAAGTSVTITGSNLGITVGVVVGHVTAKPVAVSNGEVIFIVPPGATSGPIELLASSGTRPAAISSATFTVIGSPRIIRLAPAAARPGSSVTAVGIGFNGVTSVTLDGRPVRFVVYSSTTLTFMVPFGAQSGLIAITTSAGTATARLTVSR
ncbi:MAG: ELWxxDGT repeat protein [Gaiellaceae bacterium]